jgi:cysteine desulfurase
MTNNAYFDFNATTPICQEAKSAVVAALDIFANPSAAYRSAVRSKSLLAECRSNVAALINAEPEQIFFTSGGTESNNWIINTVLRDLTPDINVVTSAIEHDSILATLTDLCTRQERQVTAVSPQENGIVDVHLIAEVIAMRPTGFMTLMYANNETGAIQPVARIGQLVREAGLFFHVDAVQAAGKIPVDVRAIGCDSLSLSAHKFHGPKGVGALYVRDPDKIAPWIHGGAQELGFRSGTENLQGVAGMGAAAKVVKDNLPESLAVMQKIREELLARLDMAGIRYRINSPEADRCLPNTVNLSIFGVRAEALAAYLSLKYDIEVSIGSACGNNKKHRQSHVLKAMGLDQERINGAIRISFGKHTGPQDLDRLVNGLRSALGHLTDLAATG